MADCPAEMLTGERVADQDFPDNEILYRRFSSKHLMPGPKVNLAAIDLPDMSVNRSKGGGTLEHVLVGNEAYGVFGFFVGDIPSESFHNGRRHSFKPVHVPHRKNYFHSEIQCFDFEGVHIIASEAIPQQILFRWRYQLREKTKVLRTPATTADSAAYM